MLVIHKHRFEEIGKRVVITGVRKVISAGFQMENDRRSPVMWFERDTEYPMEREFMAWPTGQELPYGFYAMSATAHDIDYPFVYHILIYAP
jgi:hypothetical protein